MNYYNEFDPRAAQWLKNLIQARLIPPGVVDTRSITEVMPDDLRGFTQCHFFAGIGGWSRALELAGWSPAKPVWTGSCPCQPYSVAGAGNGDDDPRALWWAFRWLITYCNPSIVLGEQVASKDGKRWFAGVRSDLEALGYAVGGADLCAAGVKEEGTVLLAGNDGFRRERVNLGPPHIRQRLFWVADTHDAGRVRSGSTQSEEWRGGSFVVGRSEDSWLGDVQQQRLEGHAGNESDGGQPGRLGTVPAGPATSAGGDCWSLIPCGDGKARRLEPGIVPLVDGFPGRVELIKGYGNAIHPGVGAQFIAAYMETHQ